MWREIYNTLLLALGIVGILIMGLMILGLSAVERPARSGPIGDMLKTEKGTQQVFEMVCRGQRLPEDVAGCVYTLQLICGRKTTPQERGQCIIRMFE